MYFQCLEHTYCNYTFKLCVANKFSLLRTSKKSDFPCLSLPLSSQRALISPQLKPVGLFAYDDFIAELNKRIIAKCPLQSPGAWCLFFFPPPFLRLITASKSVFSTDPSNPL